MSSSQPTTPAIPQSSSIGQRLHDERARMKMTLKALSDASGLSTRHLHHIEHGRYTNLSINSVYALACALGVQPAWLAWGEDGL